MGIDAEMLLRVRGPKPTDEQIAKWGDALCRSIGAKHFFIEDGLPPEEYRTKNEEWHKAFNNHPKYPNWKVLSDKSWKATEQENATKNALHAEIFADIGKYPNERRRAIELTNYIYELDDDSEIPEEYREPGRCWLQDGDTIYATSDEWFLDVSVWTRYYGVGYERGDLLTLCAIAEWCEANIPNCEVWYGGDSSGCCAEPWPDEERRKLRQHLYSRQGRDYFNRGWGSLGRGQPKHPDPCSLCIGSGDFAQFGSGHNYIAVCCAGCGKSFESHDDGVSWATRKDD